MTKHWLEKIALVTGGSRSIGRETALELAERGADVPNAGRRGREYRPGAEDRGQRPARRFRRHRRARSNSRHSRKSCRNGIAHFDILINNVGS